MIYTGVMVVRHGYDELLLDRVQKLFAPLQKGAAYVKKLYDDDMGTYQLVFTISEHSSSVVQGLAVLYDAAHELGIATSMTLYKSELFTP